MLASRRAPQPAGRARLRLRPRAKLGLAVVVGASCTAGAVVGASAAVGVSRYAFAVPGIHKLLGQRIMVAIPGLSAGEALLARVRAGEVGAVILFSQNIAGRRQVESLVGSLQRAARLGHNPPLLVAVDQEGGEVKRFAAGPPDLSPPQIARTGSVGVAGDEGRRTGAYLRGLGVDWNLAPVADVPTSTAAFIYREGRAFAFSPAAVARYAEPFALGLQSRGVAATAKHFPGVGSATIDTDVRRDELHPSPRRQQDALAPYRSLIAGGVDSIMVATAGYPGLDPSGASAALSRPIVTGLLRGRLGYRGVVITDSLTTPTGHDPVTAGVLAAQAGADILLYPTSAGGVLPALERSLRSGRLSRAEAVDSYERILALKQRLGGG